MLAGMAVNMAFSGVTFAETSKKAMQIEKAVVTIVKEMKACKSCALRSSLFQLRKSRQIIYEPLQIWQK